VASRLRATAGVVAPRHRASLCPGGRSEADGSARPRLHRIGVG